MYSVCIHVHDLCVYVLSRLYVLYVLFMMYVLYVCTVLQLTVPSSSLHRTMYFSPSTLPFNGSMMKLLPTTG